MEKIANYAVTAKSSKGRKFPEESHRYRSPFERDLGRIIHCSAFRRLEGKTQVFTPGVDDHYRTRLTHSIEVAQIGKTVARVLEVNQDLTDAICLAHDLGHAPFGHTGEAILNSLMEDFGGFEHNRQSLRIVTKMEHPYPDFAGLNLMYETHLGLAKHSSVYDHPDVRSFGEANCSLEGQIADMADRIAYNCHDFEDGMRAGLITEEQLEDIGIFKEARTRINAGNIKDPAVASTRTAKAIIDLLVSDCIDASREAIASAGIESLQDVYDTKEKLIVLSAGSNDRLVELEQFLLKNFYLNPAITKTEPKIRMWFGKLFEEYSADASLMPSYFQRLTSEQGVERTVADYIAGMTDRFCLRMAEKN